METGGTLRPEGDFTFDLSSERVHLGHEQLLLILQDLKLGVIELQLSLIKQQLQLVYAPLL